MHLLLSSVFCGYTKKITTVKQKILFILISAGMILLFVFFIARSFFRPIRYEVIVSDKLYGTYIKGKQFSGKLPFTVVRENDRNALKIHFFGAVPVTAAFICEQMQIPLFPSEDNDKSSVIRYRLSQSYILPTIPADFTASGSNATILSPSLDVHFAYADSMGHGMRAIPVDGIYAGQDGYQLTCSTDAVCTVFVQKIKPALDNWCTTTFSSLPDTSTDKEKPVFVSSVGDIMVARGTQDILLNEKDGIRKVFKDTLPLLQNSDITIGNLEGVVTDSSKNADKTYTFKFKKAVLPFLKQAGFTYLMQTNNHCYDFGEEGFKDTLDALKENNIATSGVGEDIDEAEKFYHTSTCGQRFAILSCGAYPTERSGFSGKTTAVATKKRAGILWAGDDVLKNIKKEKTAGNFVIINVHGGEEYHFTPDNKQIEFYRQLCDAGADIVFGSHPHVLQKPEWYNNSLIVYSQGNFLFNGMSDMKGATDSEIVRVGIFQGRIVYCEIYPAVLEGKSVSLRK